MRDVATQRAIVLGTKASLGLIMAIAEAGAFLPEESTSVIQELVQLTTNQSSEIRALLASAVGAMASSASDGSVALLVWCRWHAFYTADYPNDSCRPYSHCKPMALQQFVPLHVKRCLEY